MRQIADMLKRHKILLSTKEESVARGMGTGRNMLEYPSQSPSQLR